ncbi:MAG TPA: PadR family transcriptional regulator [Phototrophicaceae bacterium]|nr:PadR family transcriptional regulator [Phototrophicaceae bacterium]
MERELLLLGLLRQADMHGYQLHEFINQNMASCVELKKPTAYYLLDKMAESGWITQTEIQEGNRPPRRVYQVTPEGEAVFQRLLRENLAAHLPQRFAGDIGLAFLDSLPPAEARTYLLERRKALAAEVEAAQAIPAHAGSMQLVIDHLRYHLTAELRWLDEVLHHLTEEEK